MTILPPPLAQPVFSRATKAAPAELRSGNAVHLWLLNLEQFTRAHLAEAERIMSDNERERVQKTLRGKESYIASRWLVRKVLAQYTGAAPDQIAFVRSAKGKPYLPDSDIHFSLSHSGIWALLAVTTNGPIGVDIESIKVGRNLSAIAKHYYHPQELAHLESLTNEHRGDYFYRLWTLKEAFFKALGTGISAGLDKIRFEFNSTGPGSYGIDAHMAAELNYQTPHWHFGQWALNGPADSPQSYCALACNALPSADIKWFDALAEPAFP